MINPYLPTAEFLRKLLRFDPETGKLFWRARRPHLFDATKSCTKSQAYHWNRRWANKEAFTAVSVKGYKVGTIWGEQFIASRVIWVMHYGSWPDGSVIHENKNKIDNRIGNLVLLRVGAAA